MSEEVKFTQHGTTITFDDSMLDPGDMMPVVKVTLIERMQFKGKELQFGQTVVWDLENEQGWLEEVKNHMTEDDPERHVMVSLEEMDANEFHNLPEFKGY